MIMYILVNEELSPHRENVRSVSHVKTHNSNMYCSGIGPVDRVEVKHSLSIFIQVNIWDGISPKNSGDSLTGHS